MTHAEVSARRQELLIPKIAQRIMDARTPEVAEALAVEIIETIKFVERAATMVAETAARRAPKRHKAITFQKDGDGNPIGAVVEES